MLVDENENENESENVDLSARSEVLFDFIERCARCALMSHDPRACHGLFTLIMIQRGSLFECLALGLQREHIGNEVDVPCTGTLSLAVQSSFTSLWQYF